MTRSPTLCEKLKRLVRGIVLWRRVRRWSDIRWQVAHYKALDERHYKEALHYRAVLFDAWQTMRGQTRGLQRQARKIKRLEKRIQELSSPNTESRQPGQR
jgi:hypothetical protein